MQVRIVKPKVYCILTVAHCVQAGNPWTFLYDSQTILLIRKFINVTVTCKNIIQASNGALADN